MAQISAEQWQEIVDRQLNERLLLINDFYSFAVAAWPTLEGGQPMQTGWAMRSICEHLEEVYHGRIKRLLINIPPRCSKSSLVSVLWPIWAWMNNPQEQFLCVSYVDKLAMRDNVRARRVIKSKWFQDLFGELFTLSEDQDTKIRVDNMEGGYRVITSVDGSSTGDGGSILLIDDPNNVKDQSQASLDNALEWWTGVMPTRFNNFNIGRMVVVQQRTNEQDISGYIIENESEYYVKLILPMEFEPERKCVTVPTKSTNGKPWEDPRTVKGELLWPERFDFNAVQRLKKSMGSEYMISGQLQQRPSPAEGGLIKKKWFKIWQYKEPPECEYVLQSWDTAMTEGKSGAYSAVTTWGVFKDEHQIPNIILLSAFRKKMEFPELYDCVLRMSHDYLAFEPGGKINTGRKPDVIVIEDKASGITLSQQLSRLGINPVRFNPTKFGDKINRVRRITHFLEAGRVWVPGVAPDYKKAKPFADELIEMCAKFPNAESRDWVDTLSQALLKLSIGGWVHHPSDVDGMPKTKYVEQDRPPLY